MAEYTSITITKEGLADLHEAKRAYYGDIAEEVSNERFIEDMMGEVVFDE